MSDAPKLSAEEIKESIALPKTDFPMRAGLPAKEPEFVKTWWEKDDQGKDLYKKLLEERKDEDMFLLHWGPPFANGHLHIGHSLTYILKDVVIRSQFNLGKQAPSVTGWDCHGLPIEWKVEEKYRKEGKNKDEVSVLEFRQECRDYARGWKDIQLEEMKRFGIVGDWDNPYVTMDFQSEADIAGEVFKFINNDLIYAALRPVMWSIPEKTALAEAEIEYKEHKSTTIHVGFPVKETKIDALKDAHFVIWTTTPWTIPSNRLIAVHEELDYAVYDVKEMEEDANRKDALGKKIVLAKDLADGVKAQLKITEWEELASFKGSDLIDTVCHHPYHEKHEYFTRGTRVVHGDFVTTDAGTGLVHIAPSHGKDDFFLGKENGVEAEETVMDDGTYHDRLGPFAGLAVYTEDGKEGPAGVANLKALAELELLIGKASVRHEYPHSWRSKSPLIFRATKQWYIELDKSGLRQKALDAIEETQWFPEGSKNRIKAMVEGRPDWCISRQRVWGVPIAIFVNKKTGEILKDKAVQKRTLELFSKEGADAWYGREAQDFLGDDYDAADYEQVKDVIDVWFESGSTHAFVCEKREDLKWPADLYLEGSDQHRGWFQSSLLEACGTRGRAPFKQVLTNGFTLDEKGYKMSKSVGNTVDPFKICDQYGADILRLWAVNTDYTEDVRIGMNMMKFQADSYRRLRNTLRFLLGNMTGLTKSEMIDLDDKKMPELERYVLHRLSQMDELVRKHYSNYEFNKLFSALQNFCTLELSALYFDIRKDCLYCDAPSSFERRACRTVLAKIFDCLITWFAPVMVFTCEEAWAQKPEGIFEDDLDSVHLKAFPKVPNTWQDDALAKKWERLGDIRDVVLGGLEIHRSNKTIGSSLEAAPTLYVENAQDVEWLNSVDFADVCIVSNITIEQKSVPSNDSDDLFRLEGVSGVALEFKKSSGNKCNRCWKVLDEVDDSETAMCHRCEEAVSTKSKAA